MYKNMSLDRFAVIILAIITVVWLGWFVYKFTVITQVYEQNRIDCTDSLIIPYENDPIYG